MDEQRVFERRWKILGVMSLSLVIVMLNNVTLNVALPELTKELGTSNSEMQWVMDAYALVFGGTLLVMGAIGDRYGRKPALQAGLVLVAAEAAATRTRPACSAGLRPYRSPIAPITRSVPPKTSA